MHIYYQSSHNDQSRKTTYISSNFGVPDEYHLKKSLTRIAIQDRVRFLSYMGARGELQVIGTSFQPLLEMVLSLPLCHANFGNATTASENWRTRNHTVAEHRRATKRAVLQELVQSVDERYIIHPDQLLAKFTCEEVSTYYFYYYNISRIVL